MRYVGVGSLWHVKKPTQHFSKGEVVEVEGISLFKRKSEIYINTRKGQVKLSHDEFLYIFTEDKGSDEE